jgi:tagatose 1,6-diphosphate aldolase
MEKLEDKVLNKITPPMEFNGDIVTLHFDSLKPGDSEKGYVPYYHFRIIDTTGNDVGHINFRIGNTDHVLFCAGHIGYEIKEQFRGHSYAYHACITIAPFVKSFYSSVLLTCSPTNLASKHTIEKLKCNYLGEHQLDQNEQAYKNGERTRYRYLWSL